MAITIINNKILINNITQYFLKIATLSIFYINYLTLNIILLLNNKIILYLNLQDYFLFKYTIIFFSYIFNGLRYLIYSFSFYIIQFLTYCIIVFLDLSLL